MKNALDIAHTVNNDIANCMNDVAGGDENLADEMYNDPGVLSDLLGDRLFDACCCFKDDDHKILGWQVCDALLELAKNHPAMKITVERFKIGHNFF